MNRHPRSIFVLTGESGVGKTRLCMQTTRLLQQSGVKVAGVLSPARVESGRKTGIFVEDIASGERRLLAGPRKEDQGWELDPATLQWGAAILQKTPLPDVLVVDELGPLELNEGKGWAVAWEVLMNSPLTAMMVIRPSLIDSFRQRVPGREIRVLEITETSPSPEEVLSLLLADMEDETR